MGGSKETSRRRKTEKYTQSNMAKTPPPPLQSHTYVVVISRLFQSEDSELVHPPKKGKEKDL